METPVEKSKIPFNIDLLKIDDKDFKMIGEVTALQIFDEMNNFHPNGLFSTAIFGNVGTEYRNRMFGYIDLKYKFLHPVIYSAVTKLKSFYGRILDGKELAEWDEKIKSFIPSNTEKAQTGYVFFLSHFDELVFDRTGSIKRDYLITIIDKAKKENTLYMDKLLVLPAGLRDYVVDNYGKPQEDEINSLYRKVMFQCSLLDKNLIKLNPSSFNQAFISVQKLILDVFEYIKSLLEGKHKLILGKWLTRKIFNTTRNVSTANIEKINSFNDPNRLSYNDTMIGLHQYLKTIMPKSIFDIKSKYVSQVFLPNSNYAYLTNVNTYKKEEVYNIKIQKEIEQWTSQEGLEKIVANFSNLNIRHEPIYLNGKHHCLGLMYNDGKYFKFFQDIDELPEGRNKDHVKPITMAELLYISVYELNGKIPAFITRYPVIEFGSIYPSFLKFKTTNDDLQLEELDDDWQQTGRIASSFPKPGKDFFNSAAVHFSHYSRLGLDNDGDTLSVQALLADESVEEITKYLNSKEYYIDSSNRLNFKLGIDTLDGVLAYMTR